MRSIIVSKTALKNAAAISDYLETKFSLKVKNEFLEKLEKAFDTIQTNPDFFSKIGNKFKSISICFNKTNNDLLQI